MNWTSGNSLSDKQTHRQAIEEACALTHSVVSKRQALQ